MSGSMGFAITFGAPGGPENIKSIYMHNYVIQCNWCPDTVSVMHAHEYITGMQLMIEAYTNLM